jgi:uncharacterized phage-like protein YoqJ
MPINLMAVTGHRPDKLNYEYNMDGSCSTWVKDQLRHLIEIYQPGKLISGMAIGVDMIFAELGIELGIPVEAAIPFLGQESKWQRHQQERYNHILSSQLVTTHIVCDGGYSPWKMQKRNEYMVDQVCAFPPSLLAAVWNGTKGGTANCVKYALKVKAPVKHIDLRKFI